MIKICSSTSTIHIVPDDGKRLKKSELYRINETLRRKISHLTEKLNESNEETIKLKSELNKTRKKFCSLKCQFEKISEAINDKDYKIFALNKKCCQKSNLTKSLKCKCKEISEKNKEIVKKSRHILQIKNRQMKILSEKFSETQTEIKKLQKFVSKESEKEAEMKLEHKKLCNTIEELHRVHDTLQQKNENLQNKLNEKDILINDISCQLKSFKTDNCKQIKHLENKVKSLENDKSDLMDQSDCLKNELNTVKADNQNMVIKENKIVKYLKLLLNKYKDGRAEKSKMTQECHNLKRLIQKSDQLAKMKTTDLQCVMENFNRLKSHTKLLMHYAYRFVKKESNYRIQKDNIITLINEKRQHLYNIIASQYEQITELGFDLKKTNTENDSFKEDSVDDCPCTF